MRLLIAMSPSPVPRLVPTSTGLNCQAEKLNVTTIVDAFFISSSTRIVYFGRQRLTIYYCGNILHRVRTLNPSVLLYMICLLESY